MATNLKMVEAEEYRRSHCDRKQVTHQCIGKVTLAPGFMNLDCELCGMAHEIMDQEMDLCDAARTIARIFDLSWDELPDGKKKQVLIELLALIKKPNPLGLGVE